jgi:hypothetical protein
MYFIPSARMREKPAMRAQAIDIRVQANNREPLDAGRSAITTGLACARSPE